MKTTRHQITFVIALLFSIFGLILSPLMLQAEEVTHAVRLAKQYIQSDNANERIALSQKLAPFDGKWESVQNALQSSTSRKKVEPGYYGKKHFSTTKLRKKHPDDLLYFIVPKNYQPKHATGLIIFMHGGGKGSPRISPARYMRRDKPTEAYIGDIFEKTGMIGVAPSAPWNPNDHSRWTLSETDDYLADVIAECKSRFHIDSSRVFLWGHSMGGFGAFHQVQRQPDRFAAVISGAGSWTLAQWSVTRGTTFCIVHGVKDAERGVRDRHTDIQYARLADKLLTEQKISHVFKEHTGGHPVADSKKSVLDFFKKHSRLKRNPFPRHVAVASQVGFRVSKCFPKSESYWLTLNTPTKKGLLEYDALTISTHGNKKESSLEEWKKWGLTHKKVKRPGALIDVINLGNNQFQITAVNTSELTIWLHPKMVDFNKPIKMTINGKIKIEKRVTPSLITLLDSFKRRHDWDITYPAKITLQIP